MSAAVSAGPWQAERRRIVASLAGLSLVGGTRAAGRSNETRAGRAQAATLVAYFSRHAPQARLRKSFVMQADQERQTMERVGSWLQENAVQQ